MANPTPLGLLGFGVTTILLNFIHNTRQNPIDGVIIGMGIFYGGLAQIIAGIMEYKKGNTFATTAFLSYGLFWWSFVALQWLGTQIVAAFQIWPFFARVTPWAVSWEALGAYFFMWGLFTFMMFFGTLKINRLTQVVFGTLAALFFLLSARSLILAYTPITEPELELFTRLTGVVGVVCGVSAFYTAIAEVLNEMYGRTVLDLYPAKEESTETEEKEPDIQQETQEE